MSIETIVVGLDDSAGSCAAATWGADLARQVGARVIAVHASEPLDHLDEVQLGLDFTEIRQRISARLGRDWCDPFTEAGVPFEIEIEEGRPADVLIDVARRVDADLIVVGARRMGLVRTLALGSTSHKVIHEARRPVTVIHPPDE